MDIDRELNSLNQEVDEFEKKHALKCKDLVFKYARELFGSNLENFPEMNLDTFNFRIIGDKAVPDVIKTHGIEIDGVQIFDDLPSHSFPRLLVLSKNGLTVHTDGINTIGPQVIKETPLNYYSNYLEEIIESLKVAQKQNPE